MRSEVQEIGVISLPVVNGEFSMIPFNVETFEGLTGSFSETARAMLKGVENCIGTAFFTIHGKTLKAGETLRRGGPHTDGNYEAYNMTFGGGGWKIGESGPSIGSSLHSRQYISNTGGIIMASNYESCIGWSGEYEGSPGVGGDCSDIYLDTPFVLRRGAIYYGNNHFIHESLPVNDDIHRVMARITLPESHKYSVLPKG